MTTREEVERLAASLDYTASIWTRRDGADHPIARDTAKAAAALRALLVERDDLQAIFDRCWAADMRAVKAWQEANPGNDLVWPGRTEMTAWLLAERDAARAECEAHKARADRYDTEAACASILRAEVERMRETLTTCVAVLGCGVRGVAPEAAERAYEEARAALAGAPRHE